MMRMSRKKSVPPSQLFERPLDDMQNLSRAVEMRGIMRGRLFSSKLVAFVLECRDPSFVPFTPEAPCLCDLKLFLSFP